MNRELVKRKHTRLSSFDYSSIGAYYVTICTRNRQGVLSRIVGRGLAPAENISIELTEFGRIAERQLLSLQERYANLKIDKYVIMPDHIHIIFVIDIETAGASPRPTIMDIVCAYKSLTTRECKEIGFADKLLQSSFYEHIIRGRDDYEARMKYISEKPIRWYYDKLYTEE